MQRTKHAKTHNRYDQPSTDLPNDILTKVDRASMAHGLEVRVPFLDHRLIKLFAQIPEDLKLNDFNEKFSIRSSIKPELLMD